MKKPTHALWTAGEAVLVADLAVAVLEGLLLDEVGDRPLGTVAVDRLLRDVVGPAGQRPRDVPEVAALGQALDRLAQLKQSRESQRRRQKKKTVKRRDRKKKTSRTCRSQIVTER